MKILFGVFIINLSLFSQSDTVFFSSEKVGLILFTNNIDSIKYFPDAPPPNPFGPSQKTYSIRINTYDTTKLIIKVKNKDEVIFVYEWNMIPPGAYEFDWWQYAEYRKLPSGQYDAEKIFNNKSETSKVFLIK